MSETDHYTRQHEREMRYDEPPTCRVRALDDEFMDMGGGAPPPVIHGHDHRMDSANVILTAACVMCSRAIGQPHGSEARLNAIRDATSILEAAWDRVIEEQRALEGVSHGSA